MGVLTVPNAANNPKRLVRMLSQVDHPTATVFLAIFYAIALLVTYLTLVAPGKSFISVCFNDEMGILDIANRVRLGEIPYKDFHLFYGPLVALIPGLGLHLDLSAGAIFGFDSLVVSALLLSTAVVALPRRLTPGAAAFLFLFVWMLMAVPLGRAEVYPRISWESFYDRQDWAALCLLVLFYVEPEYIYARDKWLDAAAVTVLVLFQIYTKITFGVVAFGFLLANAVVSRYNRQVSVLSMAMIAFVAGALELRFHFHAAYWHCIVDAVALVKSNPLERWAITSVLIENGGTIAACAGAALLANIVGRRSVFDGLYIAGGVLAAVLLEAGIGSGHASSAPTLVGVVAMIVSLGELARRAESRSTERKPWKGPILRDHGASLACLLFAAAFSATEMGNRLIAWELFTIEALHGKPLAGMPAPLASFIVPDFGAGDLYSLLETTPKATVTDGQNWIELDIADYVRTIIEGVQVLHAMPDRHGTVFTFDMVNPFPFAANMTPPPNGYPLFWLGTPFSDDPTVLPAPGQVLGGVDTVMVPRLPYSTTQFHVMMRAYGPYLKQNYTMIKQSPHWQVWARNGGP